MLGPTQLSTDELRLLCDCVAAVCFNVAGGRENERFLSVADAVLAEFGRAAHSRLTETNPDPAQRDIAQLVLAEFASPTLRHDVLACIGQSPADERAAERAHPARPIVPALEMIDRRYPRQAFPFRAALILVAMAIEDDLGRRSHGNKRNVKRKSREMKSLRPPR